MTPQQALKILMLSPLYFKLGLSERMELVKEYCQQFAEITKTNPARCDKH